MSDTTTTPGFGKFVPGFDFLQNIAKGASQAMPQMQNLANWIAPTLDVEELDKRIGDLKAVHFWLDQNAKALLATIQALEVQKMTLATLKGMNLSMGELAEAMRMKPAAAEPPAGAATSDEEPGAANAAPGKRDHAGAAAASAGIVDPLQWWGALTQQFQQIAADAMKDVAQNPAVDAARTMMAGATGAAMGTAASAAKSARPAGPKPARKAAPRTKPRKTTARKTSSR
jgi:hypothetical protein